MSSFSALRKLINVFFHFSFVAIGEGAHKWIRAPHQLIPDLLKTQKMQVGLKPARKLDNLLTSVKDPAITNFDKALLLHSMPWLQQKIHGRNQNQPRS